MKHPDYHKSPFFLILIGYLLYLLCINFISLFQEGQVVALAPIIVQALLVFLILSKHRHTKRAVNIWAVLLILAPALHLSANLLRLLTGEKLGPMLDSLLDETISLCIGVLILQCNRNLAALASAEAHEDTLDEEMNKEC